jgi:hypothetical protein
MYILATYLHFLALFDSLMIYFAKNNLKIKKIHLKVFNQRLFFKQVLKSFISDQNLKYYETGESFLIKCLAKYK